MSHVNNAMDIFKELERSNCGKCRVPTCLAFAAAVFRGDKRLEDCPKLETRVIERLDWKRPTHTFLEEDQEESLGRLKAKIADIDFSSAAERLGATLSAGKLVIKCLGKDFIVDTEGKIVSDCHIHTWVTRPIIDYILSCEGRELSGKWVSFRDLKNGPEHYPLFQRRCEKPLKQVVDNHPDLFEHMVHIFSGKPAPNSFEWDIAVVLYPLPRVPILYCYWAPEDDLESSIKMFFDSTVDHNLNTDSLYTLVNGLGVMFEKICETHG